MRSAFVALALWMLAAPPALAEATGMAGVPAGDVLAIKGELYRLYGIDAVERLQPCYVDGKEWACGPVAIRQLEIFVANEPVTCQETGETAGELGAWAVCMIRDSDLAEAMVRTGMALAYRPQTDKYVAAEKEARAEGAGIWKSLFIEPWVWRRDQALIVEKIAERLRAAPLDTEKIDAIRLRVESALTRGDGGIEVFQGFRGVRDDRDTTVREIIVGDVEKGYLTEPVMAQLPENWQADVARLAHKQAIRFVWDDLAARPRREFSVPDAETYRRILQEQAAGMIQSGRDPILLVRTLDDPEWMGDWFGPASDHPEGVRVSRKEDIDTDLYLGTVNSIDVYQGIPPEGESFLVPRDFLEEVRFGTYADDRIVQIAFRDATEEESGRLIFRFLLGTEWLGDEVVVLTYPPVFQEDEYE